MTLFTWSGGPRSSGVRFFCFHALADKKQKKPTPLDRGPPLYVNRPYIVSVLIKDRTGSTSVSIALRATHIAFQKDTIGRTRDMNKGRAETASWLGARFSKKSRKLPG